MQKVARELGWASGAPQHPRRAYEKRAKSSGAIQQPINRTSKKLYHIISDTRLVAPSAGVGLSSPARRRVISCSSPPVKAPPRSIVVAGLRGAVVWHRPFVGTVWALWIAGRWLVLKLSNRGQPRAAETAMVEAAWDRSSSRGAQACTVPSVLCGGRQLWGTKRGKADCRSRPLRFAPRGLRAERPSGRCPVTCLSRAPAWVANPGER